MNIVWPIAWCPTEYESGIRSQVLIRTSSLNGSIQTSQLPGARWIVRLVLPGIRDLQPEVEAFAASVEGQANRIVMPHLKRLVPRGTLRGNPTCNGASRGSRAMVINAESGMTLLKGDVLSFVTSSGSQRVMVTSATGTGTITASFSPPLRATVVSGSLVTWNAPTSTFLSTQTELMVGYGAQSIPGLSLELAETFG